MHPDLSGLKKLMQLRPGAEQRTITIPDVPLLVPLRGGDAVKVPASHVLAAATVLASAPRPPPDPPVAPVAPVLGGGATSLGRGGGRLTMARLPSSSPRRGQRGQ